MTFVTNDTNIIKELDEDIVSILNKYNENIGQGSLMIRDDYKKPKHLKRKVVPIVAELPGPKKKKLIFKMRWVSGRYDAAVLSS